LTFENIYDRMNLTIKEKRESDMEWLKDRLFSNIGEKIKSLAVVSFIVGAISCIIGGIVVFALVDPNMYNSSPLILEGILLIVLGPILSWIGSWVLYGFGELVYNSNLKQWPRAKKLGDWYCSVCGTFNTEDKKSCSLCHTVKTK